MTCHPVIFLETWEIVFKSYYEIPFAKPPLLTRDDFLSKIVGRLHEILGFNPVLPRIIGKRLLRTEYQELLVEVEAGLQRIADSHGDEYSGAKLTYMNHELTTIRDHVDKANEPPRYLKIQQVHNIAEYYSYIIEIKAELRNNYMNNAIDVLSNSRINFTIMYSSKNAVLETIPICITLLGYDIRMDKLCLYEQYLQSG